MVPDSHKPDAIAAHLRATLQRSTAFQSLSPGERRGMADDLQQVLGYLTDPAAGDPSLRHLGQAPEMATALPN